MTHGDGISESCNTFLETCREEDVRANHRLSYKQKFCSKL